MKIRLANIDDFNGILKIYSLAREFMIKSGNPFQWGKDYPPSKLIYQNILDKKLYVICEDNCMHAVFYFAIEEEQNYKKIIGSFYDNSSYGVIHRVASDQIVKNVFTHIVNFCKEKIKHLRIDTGFDNKIMQHVILKNGFKECGVIKLKDGYKGIVFEKF